MENMRNDNSFFDHYSSGWDGNLFGIVLMSLIATFLLASFFAQLRNRLNLSRWFFLLGWSAAGFRLVILCATFLPAMSRPLIEEPEFYETAYRYVISLMLLGSEAVFAAASLALLLTLPIEFVRLVLKAKRSEKVFGAAVFSILLVTLVLVETLRYAIRLLYSL